MLTQQLWEKEKSALLSRIIELEREKLNLCVELDRVKSAIKNKQHQRDSEKLEWLFDEENLNCHVELPRECWNNTQSFRVAISRAMRMNR